MRARTGGFQTRSQDALNDALIFLQAREVGAVVLTANIADFDVFQQIVPNGRGRLLSGDGMKTDWAVSAQAERASPVPRLTLC